MNFLMVLDFTQFWLDGRPGNEYFQKFSQKFWSLDTPDTPGCASAVIWNHCLKHIWAIPPTVFMRLLKDVCCLKKARFTFNFAFLGCSMLPSPTFSASPFYLLGRKGWRIYSAKIWIFETLCWVTSKNDLSTKNLLPELTLLLKTPQLQSHYSKSSCCIIVSIFECATVFPQILSTLE